MSRLEPDGGSSYGYTRRTQYARFMESGEPEVADIQAVVAEVVDEHTMIGDNKDMQRIVGFAAWRTIVNRERLTAPPKPALPGHSSRVPRVIGDSEGGFTVIRSDRPAEVRGEVETINTPAPARITASREENDQNRPMKQGGQS